MVSFIDQQRCEYGIEPICAQLPIAPFIYYEYKAREAEPERLPPQMRREAELSPEIRRVYGENFRVYGARKVWRPLGRDGIAVARCMVERLMRSLGLQGGARWQTPNHDQPQPNGRSGRSGPAVVRCPTAESTLGRRFHLRCNLGRGRLRGIRHRGVLSPHHRLACRPLVPGPGCAPAGAVGALQLQGRDSPQRPGQPDSLDSLH